MKISIVKPAIFIFCYCLVTSCNNSGDKTSKNTGDTAAVTTDTATKTVTTPVSNQQDYPYEPAVSVITGTVTTETFYGPPGFGENPKTDKKEEVWLLILDKPVNVVATSQQTAADEIETKNNVSRIQLILPENIDGAGFKNKKARLTGTFFGPHTGHHRTEVLMDVQNAEAL